MCAVVGSIVTGRPVKWMEDRSENLMSTSFARDYHMTGEIAATRDGKILAVRVKVLADHGAFNSTAQPTKYPAGFFHIFTGSYDIEAAHCSVTGVYTNKAPGGVAYACSFRVTEAVYLIERMVDCLAAELDADPAELRMRNLLRPEQFPYENKTGWTYDSGDYPACLRKALDLAGYEELRKEQSEKRARGELMGIGLSFFTETVGAGPRKHMDILGLGMADGCELRVHPTGKAVVRLSVQTQGQGTRRRSRRSSPRSWVSRPRTSTSCTATPTRRRSGWVRTEAGQLPCRERLLPWWRGRCGTRRGSSPGPCWRSPRRPRMDQGPLVGRG